MQQDKCDKRAAIHRFLWGHNQTKQMADPPPQSIRPGNSHTGPRANETQANVERTTSIIKTNTVTYIHTNHSATVSWSV